MPTETDEPRRLKDVTCPMCAKRFVLSWNWELKPGTPQTLIPNVFYGELLGMRMECPHCGYQEPL